MFRHPSQHPQHEVHPGLLWVIGVISNPARFRSRYELFRKWKAHMLASGVKVLVVELAYGARPHEVTSPDDPHDIQLRTVDELWAKENMINIGIRHLTRIDPGWRYVCWSDCDIEYLRRDWAAETIHALQHHAFVQNWHTAVHLGPTGEAIRLDYSFCSSYLNAKIRHTRKQLGYDPYWHSGFAWSARREAIEAVGLLIDQSLIGAADHQMAHALIGNVDNSYHGRVSQGYKDVFDRWQARALRYVQKNIGYVPGTIIHGWHGRRKDRKYIDRWEIVIKSGFDPARDLTTDSAGLYQLNDLSPQYVYLRNALHAYFHQRSEDSIDNDDADVDIITKCPPPPVSPFDDGLEGKPSRAQTDGTR